MADPIKDNNNNNAVTSDIPSYRPDGVVHWHQTSAMSVPHSTASGLSPAEEHEQRLGFGNASDTAARLQPSSAVPASQFAMSSASQPHDRPTSGLSSTSSSGEKLSDDVKTPIDDKDTEQQHPAITQLHDVDLEKQSQHQKEADNDNDEEEERDRNVVDWDGPDDKQNPFNWSPFRKWSIAVCMGLMTFVVTFASSVFSAATMPTSKEFGVGTEVMTLATSLFVLGFAFGPIVWGPLSELYGRRIPLFAGYIAFGIFIVPVAVAQNLQTIMVCRFFGGFFASAPLGVVGGALADFFDPINRGVAMTLFGASTFIGPTFGPILGGFITMSHLGWRWTQWINLIMAGLMGSIGFFVIPETYAPVLLQRKAKKLRFQTRNWAVRAPADEKEVNLHEIVEKYLLRPFKMLSLEPILVLITLYMSLIYGIIYGFFEVFPISFSEERGYNLGVGALPFLGVLIGVIIGCLAISYITKTRTKRKMEEFGHIVPEERLVPMMIGSGILPAGMFWFAWTSSNHITPWPQIVSTIPIGAGIMMVFLQGLNYIIDVYKMNANSAIAANTFFRSWVGAGFPLFATPMFHNLGVPWAMSLLAFLCVALFPVPILFIVYGERIRKLSKYSPD